MTITKECIRMSTMNSVRDTSKDYDDLVGYTAEENVPSDLSGFIGENTNVEPNIKPKQVDPEFPEDWQNLFVNFDCIEDYAEFMNKMGEAPVPKLTKYIYSRQKDDGLLSFFGD